MSTSNLYNYKPFINTGSLLYNGKLPPFYANEVVEEYKEVLENNTEIFNKEWNEIKNKKQKQKFFLLYNENGWKTTMLYSYGIRYHKNCTHFKKTLQIIKPLKGVVTIYFSTLAPGTHLQPHWGDTDVTYRIHLGLEIPAGLPNCGIEVGGEQREWQEGKIIVFNDAHYHTAWNKTDKPRTVLIIDVIKPELYTKKWYLVPAILGAMGMGRVLYPLGLKNRLPDPVIKVLHWGASAIFMVFLPIQKMLRIFYF